MVLKCLSVFCYWKFFLFPFFIRFKFCVDDKYSLSIYIFHKGEGKTIICFFYKECVVDNIALHVVISCCYETCRS